MQLPPDIDALEKIEDIAQALRASVNERDRNNTFPRAEFFELGARGVFRLALGEDQGSLDRLCALLHGLALRSSDLGFVASLCAHLCAIFALKEFGHRSTRGLLESLVAGESLGAIANSEPNAGTDLMGLQTSSKQQGHAFILDGTKWSVTNVSEAEVILVSATARAERAQRPIDHFVLESSISGVKTSRVDDLIGLRTSVTGNLTLSNVCVGEQARLGDEGDGVTIFQHQFDHERLLTATLYLGALDTALERGVQRAQQREQFGKPIIENQYVQQVLVDARIARELLAAQLRSILAGWNNRSKTRRGSLSILKLHGLEAATKTVREVLNLLGGRGLKQDEALTRMMRDLLGLAILGGTRELHKMILHRNTVRAFAAKTNDEDRDGE